MNYLFTIYRFFVSRWDRIKQAARIVLGLGQELSEELKQVDPDSNPTGWLPEFDPDQEREGGSDVEITEQ